MNDAHVERTNKRNEQWWKDNIIRNNLNFNQLINQYKNIWNVKISNKSEVSSGPIRWNTLWHAPFASYAIIINTLHFQVEFHTIGVSLLKKNNVQIEFVLHIIMDKERTPQRNSLCINFLCNVISSSISFNVMSLNEPYEFIIWNFYFFLDELIKFFSLSKYFLCSVVFHRTYLLHMYFMIIDFFLVF